MTRKLAFILIALSPVGCSLSQTGANNYAFGISSGNIVAYSGTAMVPSPAFTVYQLVSPLTAFTSFSDSVMLKVFSDKACSQAATGTFSVTTNPQPLVSGTATFSSVTYTVPGSTPTEAIVYFSGTLVSALTSYCTPGVSIIQHFNLGNGYVSPGPNGAAGASPAVDAGAVIRTDSNGKYVVAGTSKNGAGDQVITLWRYYPNGTLDTTFNSPNGFVFEAGSATGRAAGQGLDTVVDLAIDSSGRYLVLGTSKDNSGTPDIELALWRYNSNGTLDTSFGLASSGVYSRASLTGHASPFTDQPKAMQLDSKSNIVVTGQTQDSSTNGEHFFVARLTSNGSGLDTTFNSAGTIPGIYSNGTTGAAGATGASENDIGNSIQLDSQGRVVAVGSSLDSAAGTHMAMWRLASNGTLDTSFGTNGVAFSGSTGAAQGTGVNLNDVGNSLQIDADGYYIIAGTSKNNSGGVEVALWRYFNTGSLDSYFNEGSPFVINQGAADGATGGNINDVGTSLGIDTSAQAYVVAGSSKYTAGGTVAAVWRVQYKGSLDSNFNSTGIATTSSSGAIGGMTTSTVNDSAAFIQVDQLGTYIVVGKSKSGAASQLAIWRYLNVGILDL